MPDTRTTLIEGLLKDFNCLKRLSGLKALTSAGAQHITGAQWSALFLMHGHDGHTVKDISRSLGVTSSAATQVIDGLVKGGYVVRASDPADRRLVVLTLSKKGISELGRMKAQILKQSLSVFGTLNDRELRSYCQLTKKLASGGLHGTAHI